MLESLTCRRQLKTHLPFNALKYSSKARYIYVCRDFRDMVMSLYNHYKIGSEKWYEGLNEFPGLVGEKLPRFNYNNEGELFKDFLSKGWSTGLVS